MAQVNTVIIAEKPSQAKTYSEAFEVIQRSKHHIELKPNSVFPNGAIIVWCYGHLLEQLEVYEYEGQEHLKEWKIDTLPLPFHKKPRYKLKASSAAHAKATREIVRKTLLDSQNPTLIAACDIDAEGSAIALNFINYCLSMNELKQVKIKHLWITSLEQDVVYKGFQHLLDDQKLRLMAISANARAVSDFYIGAVGSRLYSILISKVLPQAVGNKSNVYSVGRVQSPSLFLVFKREREIMQFQPKDFFELYADFQVAQGSYSGKAQIKSENVKDIQDLLDAHKLESGKKVVGQVISLEKQMKKTQAPKLHSLTSLQTKANRLWKLTPEQTLSTVQSLYEKKWVSYPRTDCSYISESEFTYLLHHVEMYKQVLGVSFVNAYNTPRKKYVNNAAVTEHFAIIPTKSVPNANQLGSMNDTEKKIYFEIIRTTLAMFHGDYVYEETEVMTSLNQLPFKTVGKVEVDKGFKSLWSIEELEEEQSLKKESQEVSNSNIPLIRLHERSDGVPRIHKGVTKAPSPYTEGQLLRAMETCGASIEDEDDAKILKDINGIGTVATRASIIETLKARELIVVEKNIVKTTVKGRILCIAIEGTLLSSPIMTAKWEAYLSKIAMGTATEDKFLDSIHDFSHHLKNVALRTFQKPELIQKLQTEAQTIYDKRNFGCCVKCGKGELVDRGSFIGCSMYKEGCSFKLSKTIAKKILTHSQITALLKNGQTAILKGFTGKTGNKFDAQLAFDQEWKLQFVFPPNPNKQRK